MATTFKLKNYTTEVPAGRSISYIEDLLVSFGASHINKEYENGRVTALYFMLNVDKLRTLPFKLPVNVDRVFAWLRKRMPNSKDKVLMDRAERIAWKQQYELLHLQLGSLELQQLEVLQVFLPYVYDPQLKETFYDKLKNSEFKQLGYGN